MAAYGIGAAAGGFADGFLKGAMVRRQINSGKLEDKANELRIKAAEREQSENERKDKARLSFEQGIAALNQDYETGGGDFQQYRPPQMGIADPSAQQTEQRPSPFRNPANLYQDPRAAEDLRYERMTKMYENYYNALSEPDKALAIGPALEKIRSGRLEERSKGAIAGMIVGAPGALDKMNSVLQEMGLGQIDSASGRFDPKSGAWTGVTFRGPDGEVQTRDFTRTDLAALASSANPMKFIEFADQKAAREQQAVIEQRRAETDSTRANVALLGVQTELERGRRADEESRDTRSRQRLTDIRSMFEFSDEPPKRPPDATYKTAMVQPDGPAAREVQDYSNQAAAWEARRVEMRALGEFAMDIAKLNPSLDAQTIRYILRNMDTMQGVEENGRRYIELDGQKIDLGRSR